jgi:hypothetical protein
MAVRRECIPPSKRRRRSKHAGSSAGIIALLLTPRFAGALEAQVVHEPAAQRPDIPLEWSAPPGCPARSDVLDSLAGLQRVDVASWRRFDAVRGRITPLSAGFRLELEFSGLGSPGRRSFVTRHCADLAHAAAVALALALDPSVDGASATSSDAEASEAALAAAGEPSEPSSRADSSPADTASPASTRAAAAEVDPTPLAFSLGLEGLFDAVTLGSGALGGGVSARLRSAGWGGEVFMVALPSHSIELGAGDAIDLALLAGGVRGCRWAGAHLGVCIELEAGRLQARGSGLGAPRSASDPWLSPGLGVEFSAPVASDIELRSRISLLAPLIRPEYYVDGTERVHEVPSVALRFALGGAFTGF